MGCNTDPVISETPEIRFESVTVYKNISGKDSMMVLRINYKDGDGDLGLSDSDTVPPFNFGNEGFYNFIVNYRVKKGNKWQGLILPGGSDTLNFNQRFQRLNLSDKAKKVSGSFDLRIPAAPYPGINPDTVQLISLIMDRKLHKSNLAASNEIYLKH